MKNNLLYFQSTFWHLGRYVKHKQESNHDHSHIKPPDKFQHQRSGIPLLIVTSEIIAPPVPSGGPDWVRRAEVGSRGSGSGFCPQSLASQAAWRHEPQHPWNPVEYKEQRNPPCHEWTAFKAPTPSVQRSSHHFIISFYSRHCSLLSKARQVPSGLFFCSFHLLPWDCLNPFGLTLELYFLGPVCII